jgi:ParB-like chromosome segregation protein Spo0J
VHELDSPQADALDTDAEDPIDSDSPEPDAAPPSRQREGLPSHYRMRAEQHYVDHIVAPAVGMPVRLIPVSDFPDPDRARSKELDALVRSIRAHGVIQPLLVHKERSAYRVIAGRKRLSAAMAAGLAEVPCIVHQVDDAGAASLRSAENIRGDAPAAPGRTADQLRAAVGSKIADGVTEIATDLVRLRDSIDLVRAATRGFERTAAVDLMAAQTWRTLWLASVTAFLSTGKTTEAGSKPLSVVVDEVVGGFEPECRLSRLRVDVVHQAPAATVDRGLVALALTGAIIVTLSFVEQAAAPVVEVQSRPLAEGGVGLDVVQRQAIVPRETADRFSSRVFSARGAGSVGLAAIALAHATAAYGGASELVVDDGPGSTVKLTFPHS